MIITRDIIRDDVEIYANDNSHSKKDLCEFINFWKIKLLERGAKPGDKIGMSFVNSEIHYYAILFAAFELGMKIVSLHRPNNQKECQSPKNNAHLPLDYYIYLTSYLTASDTMLGIKHFKDNSKQCISYGPIDWKMNSDSFRSSEETPVFARPHDMAFCCTSSGTTGDPKLIEYSHQFLYTLSQHNRSALGYKDDDVMMHFTTLNHGGVITLLLPALMVCQKHHFNIFSHGFDTVKETVSKCIDADVTKIFCSNGSMVNCFINDLCNTNRRLPNATIFFLSFICPTWAKAIKEGRIKSIDSPFGCSEIGGPVFMPRLCRDNVDTFNPKYLGEPLSGFYNTKIVKGRIHTKLPNGGSFVFDDIVTDDYYFVSKNRLPKVNDMDINPLDIVELVEKYDTRYNFEVYVDEVYNEIYLITSSNKLNEMKESIETVVKEFYNSNLNVHLVFDPRLHETRISHKADKDKLAGIIENYRLTFQKNDV